MFEFIDKIKDKYRQNRVEKLLNVQKSLNEIEDRIEELSKAQPHKYIRKEPDGKGGFNYIYKEPEISKEQRDKNFKEWFGDSKVVDENGKPLVVYHGTPEGDFNEFSEEKKGSRTKHKKEDVGYHFTDNANYADDYTSSYKIKMYNQFKEIFPDEEPSAIEVPKNPSILPVYLKIENPLVIDNARIDENIIKQAKEKGYDGIFASLGKIKEYVVFNPNQIKSATGNKGTFDKNSNDITKSINDYISELAQLKLNKNKLLKSEQSLKKEDPLFKSMYDHMRFESTYKEVTKGYRQGQIDLDRCDEILKAINNDKKVRYSDNLVFNTEGKLLLLKRSELDKTFPGMYTIPGGHVDAGEDHRTAAIRELQEESGLTPDKDSQFTKVGEYEDDKVCIEYFLSYVDNDSDTLCLQSEEAWQYEWVESKELDKYEFPLNMKQNIQRILYPNKEVIVKLGKAFKNGKIDRDRFMKAVDVLSKSEKNYEELLKRLKERRDPEGIEDDDIEEKEVGKSFSHKYISKKPDGKGGWEYEYEEGKGNNDKKEQDNDKNINFKQIKEYGKRIIEGIDSLKRLSPKEEQGRLLGGRRNVEATILLGRGKSSDGEFHDRQNQLDLLKEYSQSEGSWIADYKKIFNSKNFLSKATESEVYFQNGVVFKINNFSQHEDISEMFDRISVQNVLFPETRYEVIGFTEREGEVNVIMKQPFIEMKVDEHNEVVYPTKEELLDEMTKRGFTDQGGNMYSNSDYLIEDLHSKNVCFSKNGNIMFIDPVIRLNLKGEGYDGDRELGEIIISNDFDKSLQSIDELYLQNKLSDELYEKIIEKAWNKSPIGTITTRSNGQKWKKVSETGNKDQDWQLVSKPKAGSKADESVSKEKRAEYGTTGKQPTISEHAKESSETALNNAIKESQDPEVREAAHQELDRREKEEHVKEEEKKDGGEKKEENTNRIKDLPKGKIFDDAKSLEGVFKKSNKSWSEVIEFFEKNRDNAKVEEVSLKDIHITQPNIQSNKVEKMINDIDKTPTIDAVQFKDGEISIFDGHHRLASLWSLGKEKIKVNLVKEDQEKKDGEEKKEENKHVEKFRQLSDDQIKFYLDAPYPEVKEAAKMVADERGLSVVSKEDYIKSFEDFDENPETNEDYFYKNDSRKSFDYLEKNEDISSSLSSYKFDGFLTIREYLSDTDSFSKENEYLVDKLKKDTDNISKFIKDNPLSKNLTLHRRCLSDLTFFTKLKENDIYEDKSFSSTSLQQRAEFGDFHIKILAKSGSRVSNINNKREFEYLIDKGSKFRVIEKHENGLGITVELL